MSTYPHERSRFEITCADEVRTAMVEQKFCYVRAEDFILGENQQRSWSALRTAWDNLELDEYYGGGAGVRHRRYTDFAFGPAAGELVPLEHTAYYQSERMNRFVGGVTRHFADVLPETYENDFFLALVRFAFDAFPIPEELAERTWISQIHQIRITVAPDQTTPVTPEGIHSDGYPFASVHLIDRVDVAGGTSSVYTYDEHELAELVFERPLDTLLLEDRALKHYVTPIRGSGTGPGHRSILAISFSLPDSPFTTDV